MTESGPPGPLAAPRLHRWVLLGLMGVALFFHLWGITTDLPYVTEDIKIAVRPATRIAASGNLNPHAFNYPGCTMIYPLAAVYHAWNAIRYDGNWLHADPTLKRTFDARVADPRVADFLLLGRLLGVAYALLCIPLVFLVGRDSFGSAVGLVGACLAALHPCENFDKEVRPDGASMFFFLLAIWMCIRLYQDPVLRRHILAGLSIGVGIGTKYYLASLGFVLLAVEAMLLWHPPDEPPQRAPRWLRAGAGFAAVAIAFTLTNPYFFLDFGKALKDLRLETRAHHINADGLSPIGNLVWYMAHGLPATISWPQVAAAALGVVVVLWNRRFIQLLLLLSVATFFAVICASGLHWARWLIPILPIAALLAAQGLETAVGYLATALTLPQAARHLLLAAATVALSVPSVRRLVELDRLYARPSTSVVARRWVEAHLPHGAGVAYEWATIPYPLGPEFAQLYMSKLSVHQPVDVYPRNGYRYLVTSGLMYKNYPALADQYPKEAVFYRELLARGHLLHQVDSSGRRGHEIRIYEIHER